MDIHIISIPKKYIISYISRQGNRTVETKTDKIGRGNLSLSLI